MPVSSQPPLPPGQFLGEYRVVRELGRGQTGVVYEAAHKDGRQSVAIKVLDPEICQEPAFQTRFPFASRALSLIKHPNLVVLHGFGMRPDRSTYVVMEKLGGDTLGDRLARGGPLPELEALRVARQVAQALCVAEDVHHGDLHPRSVMLVPGRDGTETAKVLGFGMAKLASGKDSDGKDDVRAVGLLLQAMQGQQAAEAGPMLSDTAALLQRMLSPDPAERPAIREVAQALAELDGGGAVVTAGKPTSVNQVVPGRGTQAWAQAVVDQRQAQRQELKGGAGPRRPAGAILAIIAVAVLGTASSVVMYRKQKAAEQAEAARRAAAATPPPGPVKVRWLLRSQPPGAQVVRMPGGEALGQTPLEVLEQAGAGKVRFALRKQGFSEEPVTLNFAAGGERDVKLEALPGQDDKPAPRAKKSKAHKRRK